MVSSSSSSHRRTDKSNNDISRRSRPIRGSNSPEDSSKQRNDDKDAEYIDTSWRWWNAQLKPSGWIRFTPEQKYCEQHGFVPVQYTKEIESSSSSLSSNNNNDDSKKKNKNKKNNNSNKINGRQVVRHVMKHGTRGIHYAIGWLELYHLVKKFGSFQLCDQTYPGTWHELIMDYKGAPLAAATKVETTTRKLSAKIESQTHDSDTDAIEKVGCKAAVAKENAATDQGTQKQPSANGKDAPIDIDNFADAEGDCLDLGGHNKSSAAITTANGKENAIVSTDNQPSKATSRGRSLKSIIISRREIGTPSNASQTEEESTKENVSLGSASNSVASKRITASNDSKRGTTTQASITDNKTPTGQQERAETSTPAGMSTDTERQLEQSTVCRRDSTTSIPSLEPEPPSHSPTNADWANNGAAQQPSKKRKHPLILSSDQDSKGKSRDPSSKEVASSTPTITTEPVQKSVRSSPELLTSPIVPRTAAGDRQSVSYRPYTNQAQTNRETVPNGLLLRISEYRTPALAVDVCGSSITKRKASDVQEAPQPDNRASKKKRTAENIRRAPGSTTGGSHVSKKTGTKARATAPSTVQESRGTQRVMNAVVDLTVTPEGDTPKENANTTAESKAYSSTDLEQIAIAAFMAGYKEALCSNNC